MMAKFIVRRLILLVVTMWLVSLAIFFITESSPGNVARNILGPFATPEQEASFLSQNGLDRSIFTRYLFWCAGSDWYAARKTGLSLKKIITSGGFEEWWVIQSDGHLVRWKLQDENLIAIVKGADGKVKENIDNNKWTTDETGVMSFWGVDTENHAVRWVKGGERKVWTLLTTGWVEVSGGPVEYIPLKKGLLRGDPGISLRTGRPVIHSLLPRVRNSLVLAGLAFLICMPLALVLGVIAGLKEGRTVDRGLSITGMIFSVTPEFATGIFLILIMAAWLKILPGVVVFGEKAPWQRPDMLILPVLTLILIELGYILRITRASIVEVMKTPYIRTAFLKGLPYRRVIVKHALRNALMAPITVIMLHVNWLMGGIVVTEVVFSYPGLGTYLLDSALYKDVNALEAGAIVLVIIAVGTQLIADIIYTFLNPRIRYT
jgi:peptide/nickel transport system permease protein